MINRAWIDKWVEAINASATCRHNGRNFNSSLTIIVGEARFVFHVLKGRIRKVVDDGGPLEPSEFSLIANDGVWQKMFAPNPEPMFHAIFAAVGTGNMKLEGNVRTFFQQMFTLSTWILVGRNLNGTPTIAKDPEDPEEYQAVGRYVNVSVGGVNHKVFYFEAGEGVPVVCQHTAGAENRQWRHLLEDRELTKNYRIIAFDLPAHGKSDLSAAGDFFDREVPLTSEWATSFVVALIDALKISKPIYIGCSIGGVIACHLAEKYPDRFRGIIGLAGAIPTSTNGYFSDWWLDPTVNGPLMMPGFIDCCIAPGVSRRDREMNRSFQNAHPSAMHNDLNIWGKENVDPSRTLRIDASKVPLHLYAGQYDFTCPPDLVEQTARNIGAEVHYETLVGLGHFPMSEDYEKFRPVLMRALKDIEDKTLEA